MNEINALKEVVEVSNTMVEWVLWLIGGWGSITLLSPEGIRPKGKMRWIYLLFPLSLPFFCWSIVCSNLISRQLLTAMLLPNKPGIDQTMNDLIGDQLSTLSIGLVFFGLWLLSYFSWWVWWKLIKPQSSTPPTPN